MPDSFSFSEIFLHQFLITFWSSLEDLSEEGLKKAHSIANFSSDNEWRAGLLVEKRENEYLVKISKRLELAENTPFKPILS